MHGDIKTVVQKGKDFERWSWDWSFNQIFELNIDIKHFVFVKLSNQDIFILNQYLPFTYNTHSIFFMQRLPYGT